MKPLRTRTGKSQLRKRIEVTLGMAVVRLLRAIACAGSHKRALRVAGGLGRVFHFLFFWWRSTARENLRRAFPEWSEREVRRCARLVFVNLAKTVFEFLRSRNIGDDEFRTLVRFHGAEHLAAARNAGKPLVLIAAHYDNWEWLGRRIVLEGFPLTVVARAQDDPRLTALVNETRAVHGYRVVDRSDVRGAMRALRRNEVLGILPDQNTAESGAFVEFFGRQASTAVGPYRLARRSGAGLVLALSRRAPDDTHDGYILPLDVPAPTGDDEADEVAGMQAITKAIEAWIRVEPAQWLWVHKRWRTRPPGEETE